MRACVIHGARDLRVSDRPELTHKAAATGATQETPNSAGCEPRNQLLFGPRGRQYLATSCCLWPLGILTRSPSSVSLTVGPRIPVNK
jgi:hypothetical protein